MHKENQTYQLVPGEEGDQHWLVRIIDGVFNECVIQYGSISINEEKKDEMNFNFFVESSPDPELTSENPELQELLVENDIDFEEACTLVLLTTNQY